MRSLRFTYCALRTQSTRARTCTIAKYSILTKLLEDLLDSNVLPHRAFPLEAIVLFPLLGPPALALLGATLYAAMLMIFLLSPGAILALPIYFFFWAPMAYAALWPAAAAAGVLYALAVRFFAPPVVVTAMIAGAIGAVGYGIALMLLGLAPFGNLPDGSGISTRQGSLSNGRARGDYRHGSSGAGLVGLKEDARLARNPTENR